MFGRDQRLPVLFLRDGKHGHADVITLTWEISSVATLNLTLRGGRGSRDGLWGGGARGLRQVCCRWQEAKTRPCEPRTSQVAGGVEAPLSLGRLREGIGGIADGWVRGCAGICLAFQVNIRENLPAVATSAVSNQTGWSLERYSQLTDFNLTNWWWKNPACSHKVFLNCSFYISWTFFKGQFIQIIFYIVCW